MLLPIHHQKTRRTRRGSAIARQRAVRGTATEKYIHIVVVMEERSGVMLKNEETKAMGTNTTAKYVTRTRFVFIFIARLFSSTEMRAVANEMMAEARLDSVSSVVSRPE